MNRLCKQYLALTFALSYLCWGVCILGNRMGILVSESLFLNLLFLLGGFAPTIASYLSLKKEKRIKGFLEWLKNVFGLKQSLRSYLLLIFFVALYLFPQYILCGGRPVMSFVEALVLLPLMILGGGLEEAGWRYVLQPELEKKYSFAASTLLVGCFWWLWHLPLFFISEAGQYGKDYLVYGVGIIGVSFALAALKRTTGSVWLCVLFHCLLNLLPMAFALEENLLGNIVTALLLAGVGIGSSKISGKKGND